MDDLRRRFANLDLLAAPDLEPDIRRRVTELGSHPVRSVVAGRPIRRQREVVGRRIWAPRFAGVPVLLLIALLVAVLVSTLAVGSGWWLRSVVTAPTESAPLLATSSPSTLPTEEATTPPSMAPRNVLVAYAMCDRTNDPSTPTSCAGDWRIWLMNGDGSGAHQVLPDQPGIQIPIAWSPDGSKLLYQSGSIGGLATVDVIGTSFDAMTADLCPAETPGCIVSVREGAYSPDGGRLAYTTSTPCTGAAKSSCSWQDGTITVLDIATGRVTLLEASRIPGPMLCCDGYYRPAWSPDGTRLAFGMPSLSTFIIDADGGNARRLGAPGQAGTAPWWSPDGSTIASVVCGGQPTLYFVQPDSGDARAVEFGGCDFQWTRDGRIVFTEWAAAPGDPNRAWIMDADGGNVRRLDDSVSALTEVGCLICPLPPSAGNVNGWGLWQPIAATES